MTIFGTQPTMNGSEFYGISTTPYQIAQFVPSWPGGRIDSVNVYAGGWTGTCDAHLCIWDGALNLLWASGLISLPTASGTGANQQGLVTVSGLAVDIAAAGGLNIGLWRDPAGKFVYSRDGNSSYAKGTNAGPGNFTGLTTSTGTLTAYVTYTPAPTISSFTPAVGGPGTSVVISGTNFTGASSVKFNGTTASYTVDSAIQITATVPVGATVGTITVTTAGGTATSASNFTPSTFYIDDGSSWVPCVIYIDDGSSWVLAQLYIDNGTSWTQIA